MSIATKQCIISFEANFKAWFKSRASHALLQIIWFGAWKVDIWINWIQQILFGSAKVLNSTCSVSGHDFSVTTKMKYVWFTYSVGHFQIIV